MKKGTEKSLRHNRYFTEQTKGAAIMERELEKTLLEIDGGAVMDVIEDKVNRQLERIRQS